MSVLYVTDLDGTLLNENAALSQSTVDILRPLVQQGLPLAVATARSPATAVDILRPLGLTLPAALITGAMLYDMTACRVLSASSMGKNAVAQICDMLETTGQEALAYSVKDGQLYVYYKDFACPLEEEFVASRLHSPYKKFVRIGNYEQALKNGETLMFLFCMPDLRAAHTYYTLLSAVADITCYFYAYEYSENGYLLEVYPKGCDKASALRTLRAATGAQQVIAFGDNINDIPMFHAADVSCAVANAAPETKEAATYEIGPNTQDSVAKWIAAHWQRHKAQEEKA